jgi:hypothetical protein
VSFAGGVYSFHNIHPVVRGLKAGGPAISFFGDPQLSDTASRRLWLYQLSSLLTPESGFCTRTFYENIEIKIS